MGFQMNMELTRCHWPADDAIMIDYYDNEWGLPVYDDNRLFETLVLSGTQADLSWHTVLYKRDRYRRVFDGFDFDMVARYGEK